MSASTPPRRPRFRVKSEQLIAALKAQKVSPPTLRKKDGYLTRHQIAAAEDALKILQGKAGTPATRRKDAQKLLKTRAIQHKDDEHPRDSGFHDVLLVRKNSADYDDDIDDSAAIPAQEQKARTRPTVAGGAAQPVKGHRFDRFRVIKEGEGRGGYQGPNGTVMQKVGPAEEGYREVMNLAVTEAGEPDERGPVFSTLPLNPDPAASSSCTCYLLNPGNLNYITTWTAQKWSDSPGNDGPVVPVGDDTFSLLIATPGGKVYFVEKKHGGPLPELAVAKGSDEEHGIVTDDIVFREVNLKYEPEVWSHLRNGCVIGRTMFTQSEQHERSKKVVPLVNIQSLLPAAKAAEVAKAAAAAE